MSIGLLSALKHLLPAPAPINNNSDLQTYVKNSAGPLGDNKFLKDIDATPGGKVDGIIIADDLTRYLDQHKNPTTGIEGMEIKFAQTLLEKMTQFGDKALTFDPNNANTPVSFTA
jgi:hypothetical protein